MWIVITTAFIDKLADDPEDAEVPVGKKMNVTAERGAELIGLGLADATEGEAQAAVASAPKPRRARPKAKPEPAAPIEERAPPPHIVTAETGTKPIDLGLAEPVDGPTAAEDTPKD